MTWYMAHIGNANPCKTRLSSNSHPSPSSPCPPAYHTAESGVEQRPDHSPTRQAGQAGMKDKMNFKQALKHMRGNDPRVDEAKNVIFAAVEPLCKKSTTDEIGQPAPLGDWLAGGEYDGHETPQSIAAEWDEISTAE